MFVSLQSEDRPEGRRTAVTHYIVGAVAGSTSTFFVFFTGNDWGRLEEITG
jgi:hypothetical protein